MARRLEILVPTGSVAKQAVALAPRPGDLRSRVIGLLDNGKSNTGPFMAQLAARLPAVLSGVTVVSEAKPSPAQPASDELLQRLAERCDVVINGIAD